MIFGGQRLREGRPNSHQIGREKRNLNLGMVVAVEDDRFFGLCETNNRTDLLQPGYVLGRHKSNQSQNTTEDKNAFLHISSQSGGVLQGQNAALPPPPPQTKFSECWLSKTAS